METVRMDGWMDGWMECSQEMTMMMMTMMQSLIEAAIAHPAAQRHTTMSSLPAIRSPDLCLLGFGVAMVNRVEGDEDMQPGVK